VTRLGLDTEEPAILNACGPDVFGFCGITTLSHGLQGKERRVKKLIAYEREREEPAEYEKVTEAYPRHQSNGTTITQCPPAGIG
jgi:hypothetical protein